MQAISSTASRPIAFTLLEVMLAVVVAAVILIAINTVFFGALRLRTRTTESLEAARPLERALMILQQDLENLAPPGGALGGTLQTPGFMGSTASQTNTDKTLGPQIGQVGPEFRTATGRIEENLPWSEVQRVAYLLLDSTNSSQRGRDLVRSVSRNLLSPTTEIPIHEPLLSGVEQLEFSFYDGTQWREYWDSTTEERPLPQAIKVEIQMAANETRRDLPPRIELVVPMLLDGSTNQTSQTTQTDGGAP